MYIMQICVSMCCDVSAMLAVVVVAGVFFMTVGTDTSACLFYQEGKGCQEV